MSKKSKHRKKNNNGKIQPIFTWPETSGRLFMAVFQAGRDASAGHNCLTPQELKAAQPALTELCAFEDQALRERTPSAINARMLAHMAIILCRAGELTYGRRPRVTPEHLAEARKVVAQHASTFLLRPPNSLAAYVMANTKRWLDLDWFAPAVDRQLILRKALVMWLAFELAASGLVELPEEESMSPDDDPTSHLTAPTSFRDRDEFRESNRRARFEIPPSISAELTSQSRGSQIQEWISLHGDIQWTPDWELPNKGYEWGEEIVRLPGHDDMPFIDIFPLVDAFTGAPTDKSYAYLYQIMMGPIVHLPFRAFSDLIASQPVLFTRNGLKIQRSPASSTIDIRSN